MIDNSAYLRKVAAFFYPGHDFEDVKNYISPSSLRLEKQMSTPLSLISWDVLTNAASVPLITENRLQQSDGFVVNKIGLFIGVVTSAVANADTPAEHNLMQLFSWNNPAAITAAVADQMSSIYNGYLQFVINSHQSLPYMEGWEFYRSPDRTAGLSGVVSQDAWVFASNGFRDLVDTNVWFRGQDKLSFSLQLAAAADFSGGVLQSYYLVLKLKGLLCTNVYAAAGK